MFETEDKITETPVTEEMTGAPEAEVPAEPATYEIVGIRFKTTGKIYYFDPKGLQISESDHAIVETARGIEYGMVVIPNRVVTENDVVLPLRPVIRIATEEDDKIYEENKRKEKEASKNWVLFCLRL